MVKTIVRELLISEKCQLKKRILKKNTLKDVLKKTGLKIIHKELEKAKMSKKYLENKEYLDNLKKLAKIITTDYNKAYSHVLRVIEEHDNHSLVTMFKQVL
jgi:hypothetical protein